MKQRFYTLFLPLLLMLAATGCDKDSSGDPIEPAYGGGTGQGGSLARFTISRGHLYVVDGQQLYTYSLANPRNPVQTSSVNVGIAVETIYPYADKLFIGSQQAMYIYSLANAATPALLAEASHVRACDPVVANDSLAYVTVRTGTTCGGNVNSLIIYNIRNVLQPIQVNAVPLNNPSGLGLGAVNKRLYVCDGASGLKVFNLATPQQPTLVKTFTGHTFQDVIVLDDLLVCGIEGGTALYTIGANDDIQFAAKIED